MIDQDQFLAQMSLLSSRFNRVADVAVFMMYKNILDEQIDTLQFQKGALIVFARDTFFPTPERIIEAALGEIQDSASAQWLEMLRATRADRKAEIDEIARLAIEELGGTTAVRTLTDQNQLMRVRTEFISNYARIARARRQPLAQALPVSRAA